MYPASRIFRSVTTSCSIRVFAALKNLLVCHPLEVIGTKNSWETCLLEHAELLCSARFGVLCFVRAYYGRYESSSTSISLAKTPPM